MTCFERSKKSGFSISMMKYLMGLFTNSHQRIAYSVCPNLWTPDPWSQYFVKRVWSWLVVESIEVMKKRCSVLYGIKVYLYLNAPWDPAYMLSRKGRIQNVMKMKRRRESKEDGFL